MQKTWNRRHLLTGMTAFGAAGLIGARKTSAEKAPLDTTTVRFAEATGICIAPQFVAEELLRADGFTAPVQRTQARIEDLITKKGDLPCRPT